MASIRFDIPSELDAALRALGGDANQAAKEAFLVDLYRRSLLTRHQLAQHLGLSRLAVDGVLKRHDVPVDASASSIEAEAASLRAPGP